MDQTIREFNRQFEYEPIVENGSVEPAERVVIAGMGGSHLAADLLKAYDPCFDVMIHKDYGLPCPLDKNALYVANSYSGNTEETLDFFDSAVKENLNVVAVSTGGKLLELAERQNIPYIRMPATNIQPRSAVGFSMQALLKAMDRDDLLKETGELATKLDPDAFEEKGKKLAGKVRGHTPIVYASLKNKGIASNWKIRFNETAKISSFSNVFPELNHNEMVGFGANSAENFHFIFLKDSEDHPRILKRMNVLEKLWGERNFPTEIVELEGNGFLKIFCSIVLADWTAFYIAQANKVDPERVALIDEFKRLI